MPDPESPSSAEFPTREKLQREVMVELDNLEKLVEREQRRDPSRTVPDSEKLSQSKELSNLKKEMEALNERFIGLCARVEAREDIKHQPAKTGVFSVPVPTEKRTQKIGLPAVHQVESPPNLLEDELGLLQPRAEKRRLLRHAGVLVVFLVGCVAAWQHFGHLSSGIGQVAITSEPAGADVFVEDQFRGQTPIRLKSVQAGSHRVHITKEGYEPLVQELHLSRGETASLDVRLKELTSVQLQVLAQSLFDQGKLREADRVCTLLFKKPPYDAFALDLKTRILTRLLAQIGSDGLPAMSTEVGGIPQQSSKSREPANQEGSSTSLLSQTRSTQNTKTVGNKSQPNSASTNAASDVAVRQTLQSYRPPPKGSVKARETLSEASAAPSTYRKADPIDQEILGRIKNRIQSRNLAEARALLQQLPASSQAVVELTNLIELAESDVHKQQNLISSALQKAESALIVGHYITPPDDNVVLHCNRGLSFDPQNQRLLALKKEVVHRSIAQARDWIQRARFEQARAAYSSLNYLSENDPAFPVRRQWFQEEISKLEFTSYPVIHEHRFGSCNGRLRMNGHVLSFVSSSDSSHTFTEALRNVRVTEAGEILKVRLDGKTYQFRPNSNQELASARDAFQAVYEQLMSLVAKASN